MGLDEAFQNFRALLDEININQHSIQTEQDARLQIINRLLTEVLGWPFSAIQTEEHTSPGFADYVLREGSRSVAVVEAKRTSHLLLDTSNLELATYKVGGPALSSAGPAIQQALSYCARKGAPFAIITSGFQWIAFWALRNGIAPDNGKAIVFPSLDSISANFAAFHDLFSRNGVNARHYQARINEAEGLVLTSVERLESISREAKPALLQKSKLATDLERVFREFFGSMTGDKDPEMLVKCFVESKESREADATLEKIARNLVTRIERVETNRADVLQEHIKGSLETGRGEFVLIIGNKGAGKSTFVDRFFQLVLTKDVRDKCLLVRLDLADASPDVQRISAWLIRELITKIESTIFAAKGPTFEELEGIFYSEYQRWQRGELRHLYESDKTQFKVQFGTHLQQLQRDTPELYLERLLQDIVRNRHLMPCIVFDNTDHFSQEFQETVFQFAQSIFRRVFSFVVCPITDRTIWQLSKAGPLQSYENTAFYLPVPSTKEILEKRVQFIKDKTTGASDDESAAYFLQHGIRLSIGHIKAFASCLEEIFINTDYLSRIVGWLANQDIRRILQITQRIITSPIISIEDLVKTYVGGHVPDFSTQRIVRALLFGDYNGFNQQANDFVLNIFSVHAECLSSPLVKLSILRVLMDLEATSKATEETYMTVAELQDYFEPTATPRGAVWRHVGELLTHRLIEPYDPTTQDMTESLRVRVTQCGKMHFEFGTIQEPYLCYVGQVTETRPSTSVDCARALLKQTSKRTREDWRKIAHSLSEVFMNEDQLLFHIPEVANYESQKNLRVRFANRWAVPTHANSFSSGDLAAE